MATALDPTTGRTQPAVGGIATAQNQLPPDEWDGTTINSEEGEVIGTARRVRQVGLYVISDGFGDLASELETLVLDDESRRFFVHDARGQVAGLIYAPHPDKMPVRAEAFRADDI